MGCGIYPFFTDNLLCIPDTCKNILAFESGILVQNSGFNPPGCKKFKNEILVPLITGLPARTDGSRMIRGTDVMKNNRFRGTLYLCWQTPERIQKKRASARPIPPDNPHNHSLLHIKRHIFRSLKNSFADRSEFL
jgi:hypothetical protein